MRNGSSTADRIPVPGCADEKVVHKFWAVCERQRSATGGSHRSTTDTPVIISPQVRGPLSGILAVQSVVKCHARDFPLQSLAHAHAGLSASAGLGTQLEPTNYKQITSESPGATQHAADFTG